MALIIGGATFSGKIGAKVYAKTGWVRQYAIPTNPGTAAQVAIRSLISTYSTAFRSFSPGDQTAWTDAAKNFGRNNRIGEKYELSGMNFYTSCAMIARLVQDAGWPVTVPGANDPPVPLTASTTILQGLDLKFDFVNVTPNENLRDDEYWMIFMTPPLGTGINFTRRSRYRLIRIVDKTLYIDGTIDCTAEYISVFGSVPPIGTKVFCEVFSVLEFEWVKRPAGKVYSIRTV